MKDNQFVEYSPLSLFSSDSIIEDGHNKQSVYGSILTLINTCIGSGLVAMPYAISQLGLLHGFLWMVICTLLIMFSLHCLSIIACSISGNNTSYYMAAGRYAPSLRFSIDLSIVVQGWGVCISYLILIGNSIPSLYNFIYSLFIDSPKEYLTFFGFNPREFSITAVMILILFPLCCQKSLRALKLVSILSFISVLYILALILSYFILFLAFSSDSIFIMDIADRIPVSLWKWSYSGVITSVPIFIFSLTCHHNLFNIYNELKSPRSIQKLNRITCWSITIVGVIYFLIASAGYITLGDGVDSKLFDSYEYGDVENHIPSEFSIILDQVDPSRFSLFLGRIALLLIVISAFPIQFFPIKISIYNMYKYIRHYIFQSSSLQHTNQYSSYSIDVESPLLDHGEEHSNVSNYLIALCYCFICLILALFVTEFGSVLSFIGATGDNYITLFFGAYVYLQVSKKYAIRSKYQWKERLSKFMILVSLALGIAIFFS